MPRTKIKLYAVEEQASTFGFKIPKGAIFLKADMTFVRGSILDPRSSEMRLVPGLWFEVDEEEPLQERIFTFIGTGQSVEDFDELVYMDTIQNTIPGTHGDIKHFVYHLYEKPKAEAP